MRIARLAIVTALLLASVPAMAEQAVSVEPQMRHQTVGQAEQPSVPMRAVRWTRARLEAAKKHWAEDQARFKECVGELDSLKKKSRRWMSYHRQGHFLEKCMKEKHPAR